MNHYLPFDVCRCNGTDQPVCIGCRRKEPGHPDRQAYMFPPASMNLCAHKIPLENINDSNNKQESCKEIP